MEFLKFASVYCNGEYVEVQDWKTDKIYYCGFIGEIRFYLAKKLYVHSVISRWNGEIHGTQTVFYVEVEDAC